MWGFFPLDRWQNSHNMRFTKMFFWIKCVENWAGVGREAQHAGLAISWYLDLLLICQTQIKSLQILRRQCCPGAGREAQHAGLPVERASSRCWGDNHLNHLSDHHTDDDHTDDDHTDDNHNDDDKAHNLTVESPLQCIVLKLSLHWPQRCKRRQIWQIYLCNCIRGGANFWNIGTGIVSTALSGLCF